MRYFISIVALLAFTGCEGNDNFAASQKNPEAIIAMPEQTRMYEFVENAPSPQIERNTPSEPSCLTSCMDEWRTHHATCANSGDLTDVECQVQAHDATAVCLDLVCPQEATNADSCQVGCDAEARQVGRDCVQAHGYDPACLAEADAVYATCNNAECSAGHVTVIGVTPIDGLLEELLEETQTAEETVAPPMTCSEMCKAYDLAVYLKCVNSGDISAALCRERVGVAEHVCANDHCPGS
ncbi:MAG: hypothetical protein ACI9OJ_001068 [Myxococcota bacterium]|jgi:hypothetical protein